MCPTHTTSPSSLTLPIATLIIQPLFTLPELPVLQLNPPHKATQEYILYAPQIAEKIQNVSNQV